MMTDRDSFERWWGTSRYTQVIYDSPHRKQIALDGWQAAKAQDADRIKELRKIVNEFRLLNGFNLSKSIEGREYLSILDEALAKSRQDV